MCSPRPRLQFVADLVPLIFESGDGHWWTRDLLRLALISSAWLDPARRRLYTRPTLDSFRACNLFVRSLRDNPGLLRFLHGLDLCPITNRASDGGYLSSSEIGSLRHILNLQNLRSLTLGGDLAVNAGHFLRTLASSQTIVELHVDGSARSWGCGFGWRATKPASLRWDHMVAFRFPNLRKLTLTRLELRIIHPHVPYAFRLTELVLNKINITQGFLPDLAHKSWNNLQSLTVLTRSPADLDGQLRLTLECCSQNIRSLRYEIRDSSHEDGIFDGDLVPCRSMQELYLSGVEIKPNTLLWIAQLFQNLEGLSIFGRNVRVTPEEWADFIGSSALPALRDLHLPNGDGPPFTYWSEKMGLPIKNACWARELGLDCTFFPDVVRGVRYSSPF